MRKIVVVLFFMLLNYSLCFGISIPEQNFDADENIEQKVEHLYRLADEAQQNNDLVKLAEVSKKSYKITKKIKTQTAKGYSDLSSALVIYFNVQKYELEKDTKYINNAYKWSKIAINDKTNQKYAIQAAILLGSYKQDLKLMEKAYGLYRAYFIDEAIKDISEYQELYMVTRNYIQDRRQNTKNAWLNVLKTVVGAAGTAAKNYSENINNYQNSHPTYHTTVTPVGNTLYMNTYTY